MKYLIIILLFASCSAAKQAERHTKQAAKHLEKAFEKDPFLVAKITRDSFPCTGLFRTDTATVTRDSLIYVQCPNEYHAPEFGQKVHDTTLMIAATRTIYVPVKVPIQTKIITKYFEDSTKIKLAQKEIINLQQLQKTTNETILQQAEKIGKKSTIIMWLSIVIAILLLLYILTARKLLIR